MVRRRLQVLLAMAFEIMVSVLFAKHPLEVITDKLEGSKLVEAIRLAIMAELDAINFYLQVAERSSRDDVRKVFEDVAREEKTHVGEFLELLKKLDPEQVRELEARAKEVKEITGGNDPPEGKGEADEGIESYVSRVFSEALDSSRRLVKLLPKTIVGAVDFVAEARLATVNGAVSVSSVKALELVELSTEFKIPVRLWESHGRLGGSVEPLVRRAAAQLASVEEKYIVDRLQRAEGSKTLEMGDWSEPGRAVSDVASAVGLLESEGFRGPYILLVSPANYAKLLVFHERTGVMELSRVEKLAKVVMTQFIPDNKALLITADSMVLDLVVGVDVRVDYVGVEGNSHVFRAWETLGVRVSEPAGIVVLEKR